MSQSSALISRNRDQLDHGDVIQNTKDEGYELLTTAAGCRMEFTSQLSMLKKMMIKQGQEMNVFINYYKINFEKILYSCFSIA